MWSWNVWNSGDNGRPVDVVVFDLDEDGKPTNHILYEENGLESENYNWHECVFKYPVVAPRGALFALRGDARLCMDHAGENPDWPARLDKMVLCKDYRTEPFNSIYPEGDHIFRGNLTLLNYTDYGVVGDGRHLHVEHVIVSAVVIAELDRKVLRGVPRQDLPLHMSPTSKAVLRS